MRNNLSKFLVIILIAALLSGCTQPAGANTTSTSNISSEPSTAPFIAFPTETVQPQELVFENRIPAYIYWKSHPFTGDNWYGEGSNLNLDFVTMENTELGSLTDELTFITPLDSNDRIQAYIETIYDTLDTAGYLRHASRVYDATHFTNGFWVIGFTDFVYKTRDYADEQWGKFVGDRFTYFLVRESDGGILATLRTNANKSACDMYYDGDYGKAPVPDGQLYHVVWESEWYYEYGRVTHLIGRVNYNLPQSGEPEWQLLLDGITIDGELDSIEKITTLAYSLCPALLEQGYFPKSLVRPFPSHISPLLATYLPNGVWVIKYREFGNSDQVFSVYVRASDWNILFMG